MKFISKYAALRVGIMPTVRKVVNGGSGSEEVLVYNGVTVKFDKAIFDTKDWAQYERALNPDQHNPIKSEDDLIRLLKANPYFNQYYFEHKVETVEDKRARLEAELAKLDAEDVASGKAPADQDAPEIVEPEAPKAAAKKPAAKKVAAKNTKSSKVEL